MFGGIHFNFLVGDNPVGGVRQTRPIRDTVKAPGAIRRLFFYSGHKSQVSRPNKHPLVTPEPAEIRVPFVCRLSRYNLHGSAVCLIVPVRNQNDMFVRNQQFLPRMTCPTLSASIVLDLENQAAA